LNVLENYYIVIKRNLDFYKKNFGHVYYRNVKDDETYFIDRLFKGVENSLSAEDKMLSYSVSTIYTATAVLVEFMDRYGIVYNDYELERMCKGFSSMSKDGIVLTDKSDNDLLEVLFGLLTEGVDLESRKKSGSERTPGEIIEYMLDVVGYEGTDIINKTIIDPACGTGAFIAKLAQRFINVLGDEKKLT